MSRITAWRHRKQGKPVEEVREYARLQSFDFDFIFHPNFDWDESRIKKTTKFLAFAKQISMGLQPYTVAKELEIPEATAYLWIEKLLKIIEKRKIDETKR